MSCDMILDVKNNVIPKQTNRHVFHKVLLIWVGWLVVFNVPSTARSFRDGFNMGDISLQPQLSMGHKTSNKSLTKGNKNNNELEYLGNSVSHMYVTQGLQ